MKPSWTWCLPLVAVLGLSACSHTDQGGKPAAGPSGPAGNAQSLTAFHWHLREAFTADNKEDQGWSLTAGAGRKPVQIDFADQRVVVKNLCNVVTSSYQIDGDRIAMQRAASTLRACNDSQLMALEQKVAQQLPKAQRWAVQQGVGTEAPRLTLKFVDGTRWQLEGSPTPETRYGGAGERIFLEVGPQRVACSHGVMKDYKCLQVREVFYKDNGGKSGTGEWQNFYSEIEGYQHQPGTRNVLRVNRYALKNVPADASSKAYVLDMVVESETVR